MAKSKRRKTNISVTTPAPAPTTGRVHKLAWLAFLMGVAVYANTLFHDYTLDDAIVIYDNEFTTKGLAGIPGLLQYDTFRGFFKEAGKEKLVSGGRYRPLTPIMFALEVQLFAPAKKDANGQAVKDAAGHTIYDPYQNGKPNAVKFAGHLINVLLFGLTGWLMVHLLFLLFSSAATPESSAIWMAGAAGLLFMVHPVHTEVVANIKGRDEIVALLGSLAALYFSLRAYQQKKPAFSLLAGALFFLGLLAKENAITFLAVVPLAFYFFTNAKTPDIVRQTLPFVLAAAIFLVIRTSILGWDFGGNPPRDLMNNPFLKLVNGQWVDFSPGEKLATIFFTLGKYLQLMIFPHPLCHDYYPRAVEIMSFGDWQVIASFVIYLALGLYALWGMKKKDPVSFGILYYLATLSIVSNLFFPIGTNMGERFIYMPSLGFVLVATVGLWRWGRQRWYQRGFVLAGALVLLLLAGKSVVRNTVWKNNFTLFTHDVKIQPRSAKLQTAAGGDLITHAIKPENASRKQQMLEEGIAHLLVALKIHPTYKNAYLLLGNACNYLQRYEESIRYYHQALAIDPNYEEAKNNLAITYANAGRYFGEQKGDLNKAIEYLLKANEMKPNSYETLRLLGVAYGISGQVNEALKYFKQAAALQPNDPDALYNLGTAYFNAGQPQEAEKYFRQARAIKPDIDQERQRQH